jgi:PAS domain S-box-containing protein
VRALAIGLKDEALGAALGVLTEHGYAALAVASSAEVLVHSDARRMGLVLVQQRADFDAAAVCRSVRAAPAYAGSVILVMMSADDAHLAQAMLDAGADDFFFDTPGDAAFHARLRVVHRLIELGRSRRAASDDLDALFEAALDLLCIADLGGHFRRVSPSWTAALGWSADELCANPWLHFVHPDDRADTVDAEMRLHTGASVIAFVNRYRCKDGSYRTLEWRVMPALERGTLYASVRDVTVERAQQEALRELAEDVTITLSSIGDGVISVDAEGAIVRMNPVAEQLTGWTERAAMGHPIGDVFRIMNAHSRERTLDPVASVLLENRILSLAADTLLVRPDGTELPIADSCAPIRTADGQVRGAVLVFRDTSAEVAARQAQEHARRQLVFADRMVSVGTLAAGMAHEINNPLAYITANLDLIDEELQELSGGSSSARMRELQDMTQDARAGAERIKKIVRGLKTFSRAEHELSSVISVKEVMELAISMTFNEIRHRTRLVKDYGEIPLVRADDARLGQVFINLLVNAAHAIPPGNTEGNEIRIRMSTDPANRAVIEIRDTGAGIPSALLDRIFDPFFTTKPVGIGTGLGLSICHNIIAGMDGEISVRSTVGEGSRFTIVLPGAPPASIVEDPAAHARRSIPAPKRAAVLVVDDEPSVGVTLSRVLREHDVTVHARAQDALDVLCAGVPFDVIFSDLMMPEMSGMELYQQLVERCPEAAQKVVFVSGGAFSGMSEAFLESVPNERLQKPFDIKEVRSLVRRFLE